MFRVPAVGNRRGPQDGPVERPFRLLAVDDDGILRLAWAPSLKFPEDRGRATDRSTDLRLCPPSPVTRPSAWHGLLRSNLPNDRGRGTDRCRAPARTSWPPLSVIRPLGMGSFAQISQTTKDGGQTDAERRPAPPGLRCPSSVRLAWAPSLRTGTSRSASGNRAQPPPVRKVVSRVSLATLPWDGDRGPSRLAWGRSDENRHSAPRPRASRKKIALGTKRVLTS
jgi:hypothetical protein